MNDCPLTCGFSIIFRSKLKPRTPIAGDGSGGDAASGWGLELGVTVVDMGPNRSAGYDSDDSDDDASADKPGSVAAGGGRSSAASAAGTGVKPPAVADGGGVRKAVIKFVDGAQLRKYEQERAKARALLRK